MSSEIVSEDTSTILILATSIISILFAYYQYTVISQTKIGIGSELNSKEKETLLSYEDKRLEDGLTKEQQSEQMDLLIEIYEAIRVGASAFLGN
jgi:hypothetical protein